MKVGVHLPLGLPAVPVGATGVDGGRLHRHAIFAACHDREPALGIVGEIAGAITGKRLGCKQCHGNKRNGLDVVGHSGEPLRRDTDDRR
jgi:hypothetical protein